MLEAGTNSVQENLFIQGGPAGTSDDLILQIGTDGPLIDKNTLSFGSVIIYRDA